VAEQNHMALIRRLDDDLTAIFHLVQRLGAEAHLDDETIALILSEGDSEHLEIVSDTVDEVTLKVHSIIVEARLAILQIRGPR
jgi:hypothetical protein